MIPQVEVIKAAWERKGTLFLVLIILALAITIGILTFSNNTKDKTIASLNVDKGKLTSQLEDKSAQIDALRNSIDKQNRAVDAWKSESEKLKDRLHAVDAQNKKKEKEIQALLEKVKATKPIPDDSKGQIDWLRDRAIEFFGKGEL